MKGWELINNRQRQHMMSLCGTQNITDTLLMEKFNTAKRNVDMNGSKCNECWSIFEAMGLIEKNYNPEYKKVKKEEFEAIESYFKSIRLNDFDKLYNSVYNTTSTTASTTSPPYVTWRYE